ncbi:hypothetical protein PILCRDRAFT_810362 [Piloderma croceum F 1598]|uniref:Hydrophobin n=1 Tax=Piloderma croceum (strain F 1598) TaxID=765440 RepID=A0A0C3CRM6_PILCF|nr:hypothetical protein PILCRDRAFT_810362 [Piloderma croceum F 1598]
MRSSILMSAVVVSNIFAVFGTPIAAQSNPSSTNAAPTGTATPGAFSDSSVQFPFACIASSIQSSIGAGLGQGATQQDAANNAQNNCGTDCDNVQCVRDGCVSGALGGLDGLLALFYGVANGADPDAADNSLNAAHANCTSSATDTQDLCATYFTQCSS